MSEYCDNMVLNAFTVDFEERIGKEETISLTQCLRRICSSKQRPLKVVQGLLLLKVNAEELKKAYTILLTVHIPKLSQASGSTMNCIQNVSAVVGFAQLLLESSTEYNQMIMLLLQGLAKATVALLKSNPAATTGKEDDEDDRIPTDRLDTRILASFAIAALLRTVNPYIDTAPFLLSPLWKGICDIVSQQDTMPWELTKEALMALLSYLTEGERQCTSSLLDFMKQRTEQNSSYNIQHYLFHIKVLSFLMTRLAALLPHYLKTAENIEEGESSTLEKVCFFVCRIRGLGLAASTQFQTPHRQDEDVIHQYKQLELKAEQCSQVAIDCSSLFVKKLLVSSTNISGELRSLHPGKLLIWLQCLKSSSFDDPELKLRVCQDLIFSTIPKCFEFMTPQKTSNPFKSILSTSIRLICSVFVQSPYRERKLHAILLQWLASTNHPMSREVLLASLHRSCIATTDIASPRSVNGTVQAATNQQLTAALSTLLFDPRLTPLHRSNVGGLLTRMLGSCDPCQSAAQSILAEEFATSLKRHTATKKRKRKRKDGEANGSYSFSHFGIDDIAIIRSVLQGLQDLNNSFLIGSIEALSRDLCKEGSDGAYGAFSIGRRQPLEVALLLSYLAGLLDGERRGMQILQQITGDTGSHILVHRISQWLIQSAKRINSGLLSKGVINAILSTLSLLRCGLSITGGRSTPHNLLISIVESLTMCSQLVGKIMCNSQHHAIMIVLEVVAVLGKIGPVVHANSPHEIVHKLASTFKNLFLLNLWPVSSECMTSLTAFVSTLPATHQGILPKCFPLEMQAFLKARLQGIVHRKPQAHKDEDSAEVHYACAKTLNEAMPKQLPSSLFSTTSEIGIEAGSLIMSMPTREGRTALVVFAPGEQSIEDIKYMMGVDTVENAGVQTLHRVKLLSPGAAHCCRFFTKCYE